MKNQLTRREFLKTASCGGALFIGGALIGCTEGGRQHQAQRGGFGRQRQTPQRGRQHQMLRRSALPIHPNNPSISHHRNRCRNCGHCKEFCSNRITVYGQTVPSGEDPCIYCGQCTLFCTRAISEKYHYPEVAKAIFDPDKVTVAFIAPSVRVSLGEMYRLNPGANVEGKIVASLKKLGINHVLDTTFAADLTVMEEATELLHRLETNDMEKSLPMFTSCCPAWVRFVKLFYPSLLHSLSTVKSPILMQGALVKTYFAQKNGIDPSKIVTVALAPCTAKKAEILLPEMNAAGIANKKPEMRDVDFSLTTREISYLLNDGKINFLKMQDTPFGSLMGAGSGAGMIFGNTGGVMEASLRTAYKLLNGKNPPDDFYNLAPVRGFNGIRQANVNLGKHTLSVAAVHGTDAVRTLIATIQKGTRKYDFVEVMACPGGCIGGGGQPAVRQMNTENVKQLRMNALYKSDTGNEIRLSCDNPQIQMIYDEFLGKPFSKKSKELLHVYQ